MARSTNAQPNVLIFMTDQQNGSTIRDGTWCRAKTPHLDRFRGGAVDFTDAFTTSPHCCPSRASFFTGTYPSEHGVWNNVNVGNALSRGPRPGVPFWSRAFADAGYALGHSGKWHVSNAQSPSDFGWQELTSPAQPGRGLDLDGQRIEARRRELARLDDRPASGPVRRAGEILRPGWPRYVHYATDEDPFGDAAVVEHGVSFIRGRQDQETDGPWCLYVGTLGPHDPYMPPKRFLDLYDRDAIVLPANFNDTMADKPAFYRRTRDRFDQMNAAEQRDALWHYMAFCSYEDALFGRLLSALEETGQLQDTIVVFTSDHGDYAGEHGLWGKGLPCFQSAYSVPFVVGGPGIEPALAGTRCRTPLSLADFGPTLSELCHVVPVPGMSGRSIAGFLMAGGSEPVRQDIFFQSNGNEAYGIQRIIVSNRWKLVYNAFDYDELYDLDADPGEVHNLLAVDASVRNLGAGHLDRIPQDLRPIVRDLYIRLWRFAIDRGDDIFDPYILTAMGTFGPKATADGAGA